MELLKQKILITGASQGLGLRCAQQLLALGADSLILTGRDRATLEVQAGLLGGRVETLVCDHAQKDAIDVLCDGFDAAAAGRPLVLIANVGFNSFHQAGPKKIQNTSYDMLEQTMRINAINTFHLISRLVAAMKGHGFGRIILVGSQAYQHGVPGQCAYNMSKAALAGLKNTIVSEYGKSGVFCHLVNPGIVDNARTEKLRARHAEPLNIVTETDVANAIVEALAIADPARNGLEINI